MMRFGLTLALALAGGALFSAIGSPLPWLLGPMALAFAGSRLPKGRGFKPRWPSALRDAAMIAIGYSIGLTFTMDTLVEMGRQLPTMILMTALLLLFSALIAWTVAKLAGLPLPTVLMGSIPGGLSQMILLAEDTKGVDLTVVTFLQVTRLMMIIFFVPLLVFSPLFVSSFGAESAAAGTANAVNAADTAIAAGGDSAAMAAGTAGASGWAGWANWGDWGDWGGLFPAILLFAVVCTGVAVLLKRIKFPSAYLLGPMIVTAALHLSGVHGPSLPAGVLDASQLSIGTYVGLLLRPEGLRNKVRIATLAVLSGAVLLAGSFGLCLLLTRLHPISPSTAFLSLAPGGMDQMGIIAKEIHADVAIVSCYQLFRTWFIFFAVPPLLRLLFRRLLPKGSVRREATE